MTHTHFVNESGFRLIIYGNAVLHIRVPYHCAYESLYQETIHWNISHNKVLHLNRFFDNGITTAPVLLLLHLVIHFPVLQ